MTLSLTHSLTHWSLTEPLLILILKSNPRDLWPLRLLTRVMRRHDLTQKDLPTYLTYLFTYFRWRYIGAMRRHDLNQKDNFGDLWKRHWLQFLQLRTWIHDNLCYLTIKSDTGQHSQFLRCFLLFAAIGISFHLAGLTRTLHCGHPLVWKVNLRASEKPRRPLV